MLNFPLNSKREKTLLTVVLIILFLFVDNSFAKRVEKLTEEQVVVSYVYKISGKILFNEKAKKYFVIDVITENKKLQKEFEILKNHVKILNKKLQIKFNRFSFEDLKNSDVVFIAKDKRHLYSQIYEKTQDLPVLLIGNNCALRKKILVNLKQNEDNTIKFEVNAENIFKRGLKIDPSIVFLGGTKKDALELYEAIQKDLQQKEYQIQKSQNQIVTLQKSLQELQTEMQKHRVQLQNYKDKITEKEQILQKRLDELHRYALEKKKLQKELSSKTKSIQKAKKELKKLENLLQKREKQESKTRLSIQHMQEKVQKKEQELSTLARQTKIKEEQLKVYDRQVEELRSVLNQNNTIILQQEYYLLIAFVLIVIGLIVVAYIIYLLKKQKRMNAELQAIDEALQAEKKKAEEANFNKSKFIANMSHELRTPLNAVLGYSKLLQKDTTISNIHKKTFTAIRKSGEHLLNLINDILLLSKIEAGNIELHPQKIDVRNFFESIHNMFLLKAKEKNIALQLHIDTDVPPYMELDADKLRQIVMNLLNNALKFTYKGGVNIDVSTFKNKLVVRVSDTGVGIAEDELEKVFQKYEQTSSGEKEGNGTGLGLSLVKELLQLMGGNISLKSTLGKGSIFEFFLPFEVVKETVEIQDEREITGIAEEKKYHYTVLIVDDNKDNRDVLEKLLSITGFKTLTATNAKEALAIFKTQKIDFVFMDLNLPDMSGTEVTRKIKEIHKDIPVVALTADIINIEKLQKEQDLFEAILPKPYDFDELLLLIERYLDIEYIYNTHDNTAQPTLHFEKLPENIKSRLLKAASTVNYTVLQEVTEEIDEKHYANEKNLLRRLTAEFNFKEIEKLLQ